MTLTPDQQARIDRAREALARPRGHDTIGLAEHCGRLDYLLRDLIALVEQVTDETPAATVAQLNRKFGG